MITAAVVFHVASLVLLAVSLSRVESKFASNHPQIRTMSLLALAVLFIIGIHTVEAWRWAALFIYLGGFSDLESALYFSVVTSTTLGYGDVTLSENWQLLGTFEAMGGLILFGTSTAFLIELMRNLFNVKNRLRHCDSQAAATYCLR